MSDEHARAVYRQLQALARAQYGGNTGALLVVYAVEGFLRRLAASPHATKMTLKGGMLMAATSARRMTKDADLSTVGIARRYRAVPRPATRWLPGTHAPAASQAAGEPFCPKVSRRCSYSPEAALLA